MNADTIIDFKTPQAYNHLEMVEAILGSINPIHEPVPAGDNEATQKGRLTQINREAQDEINRKFGHLSEQPGYPTPPSTPRSG